MYTCGLHTLGLVSMFVPENAVGISLGYLVGKMGELFYANAQHLMVSRSNVKLVCREGVL